MYCHLMNFLNAIEKPGYMYNISCLLHSLVDEAHLQTFLCDPLQTS